MFSRIFDAVFSYTVALIISAFAYYAFIATSLFPVTADNWFIVGLVSFLALVTATACVVTAMPDQPTVPRETNVEYAARIRSMHEAHASWEANRSYEWRD